MKGKLIGQGRTAEIFSWDGDKILKLYRKEIPKEAVLKEYKVSKIVIENGLPAPEVFELVNEEERSGIIYERVSGSTMLKQISSKPWTATREAKRLAKLQIRLNSVNVEGMMNYRSYLKGCILRVELLDKDIKEKVINYLDTLPDEDCLIHGDFHPDNIILTKDGPKIIDWMTACSGSPAGEAARTSIMLMNGEVPPGTNAIVKGLIDCMRRKFYREYMEHYLKLSGITHKEIEKWMLPVAAARLVENLPCGEKRQLLDIVEKQLVLM